MKRFSGRKKGAVESSSRRPANGLGIGPYVCLYGNATEFPPRKLIGRAEPAIRAFVSRIRYRAEVNTSSPLLPPWRSSRELTQDRAVLRGSLLIRLLLPGFLLPGLLLSSGSCGGQRGPEGQAEDELMVFAAASLRDALLASEKAFEERSGVDLRFNFAGSNLLALQIEASPRADVYISANEWWMEYLEDRQFLEADSRRTLVSNGLAIIVNGDSALGLEAPSGLPDLPMRHLSLADPEGVPAGRYAKEYLQGLPWGDGSIWDAVSSRVAPAPDVRGALALVEADPEIIGIVYRTDAVSSARVRILYEVPIGDGPEIRYEAAAIKSSSPRSLAEQAAARQSVAFSYLEFLGGEAAQEEFESQGFRILSSMILGDVDGAGRDHG